MQEVAIVARWDIYYYNIYHVKGQTCLSEARKLNNVRPPIVDSVMWPALAVAVHCVDASWPETFAWRHARAQLAQLAQFAMENPFVV
jgi:hypothetical protein